MRNNNERMQYEILAKQDRTSTYVQDENYKQCIGNVLMNNVATFPTRVSV